MRWPLHLQISLPMSCILLAAFGTVSLTDAWLAGRRAQRSIEKQLQDVHDTLSRTPFPLTDAVLKDMRGLSGADYAVTSRSGTMAAASREDLRSAEWTASTDSGRHVTLDRRVTIRGESFYHIPLELERPAGAAGAAVLHILYPEAAVWQAWRQAAIPPVVVGAGALGIGLLASRTIARQVTRPIRRLEGQVRRIAEGDFVPVPVAERNDELQDLAQAINRMAGMLANYERAVRRHEQLRTLGRLGGGLAHQLRNYATGTRLALDLHQQECPLGRDEGLDVASRQLTLIEEYLERFLSLGRSKQEAAERFDLLQVIDAALRLVQPKAQHLGVQLLRPETTGPVWLCGSPEALLQALVNLLLNGVEAAAAPPADKGNTSRKAGQVQARVILDGSRVQLEICDNGPGPSEEIRCEMFEPLVTDKPEGVGLGLAIAQEVVQMHRGSIRWRRESSWTCFVLEFFTEGVQADVAAAGH